jgi:cell division septation protein DedD
MGLFDRKPKENDKNNVVVPDKPAPEVTLKDKKKNDKPFIEKLAILISESDENVDELVYALDFMKFKIHVEMTQNNE